MTRAAAPVQGGRLTSHRLTSLETHAMNMPLVKTEPVTATPIAMAASATVLPLAPKRPPLTTRIATGLGNLSAHVVPPIIVIALTLCNCPGWATAI